MPVYKLEEEMPYTELLKWVDYFKKIPAEIKALPKGKFLEMMMQAKGGDDSDWTPPWMNDGKK
jgi:hypothetical protein